MKTAISIPDRLFDAGEKLAKRLGLSRSELYQVALKQLLEKKGHDVVREKMDAVYGAESEAGRLDAAVEYMQRSSLHEEDW